jgi:hypothetical protein
MGAAASSGMGKVIGVSVGALLVVGGVATAVWALAFRSPKPELARYMPKDLAVYVEAPSMPKLLVALTGVDVVDRKALDPEKRRDDVVKAVAEGLDVSEKDAKAFVMGVRAVAGGGRSGADDKKKKNAKEAAMFAAFDSTGSVKPILASKRFEADGKLASGAGKWIRAGKAEKGDKSEKADDDEAESPKDLSTWGKRVQRMASRLDDDSACVLWDDAKLLGCGTVSLLEDVDAVVSGKSEGLAKANALFKKAQWPSGTQVFAWIDPAVIDDEKVHDQYFDGVGAFVASVRFTGAGPVFTARAELKGEKVPATDLAPTSPAKLGLAKRLPAGTLGYLAFSSRTKGKYEDFEKALLKSVEAEDESKAKQLERELDSFEKQAGFSPKTLYEAIGDEGVIGVFSTKKVSLDSFKKLDSAVDELGLVYLQHVRDKDKAKEILEEMRKRAKSLGAFVSVKKLDNGFVIEPDKDGWPSATITLEDKYLVLVVGRSRNMEAAQKAFKGDADTLSKDKAHSKAMDALDGDNQIVLWVDAGRFGKAALDDDAREKLEKEGIPVDVIRLEGDDRVTMGSAVRLSVEDKKWVVELASLNGPDPLMLGLVGLGAKRKGL